jgi:hypothetical protein
MAQYQITVDGEMLQEGTSSFPKQTRKEAPSTCVLGRLLSRVSIKMMWLLTHVIFVCF